VDEIRKIAKDQLRDRERNARSNSSNDGGKIQTVVEWSGVTENPV